MRPARASFTKRLPSERMGLKRNLGRRVLGLGVFRVFRVSGFGVFRVSGFGVFRGFGFRISAFRQFLQFGYRFQGLGVWGLR